MKNIKRQIHSPSFSTMELSILTLSLIYTTNLRGSSCPLLISQSLSSNHNVPTISSTKSHRSHQCSEVKLVSMDYQDIAEIRIRARSFLYEEYNNRRVFLKSYHCGAEDETAIEKMVSTNNKRVILTVFHWSAVKGRFCYRGEHELQNLYHGLYPRQLQCPCGPNSAVIPPFLPPLGICQTGTQWWKFGALF